MSKRRGKLDPDKERIEHAMALIERGLQLMQEGDAQLRSMKATVTNPLAGMKTLGHSSQVVKWKVQKMERVERYNARTGTRNSVEGEQPSSRAKKPRIPRRN